ncbi:hypothetical protein M885DRAFT_149410 [Pelagophyceae sp. CCMP2097]|nr:hypothetical protein M885DRAFT_149410 [Pelagophyceae sp. CCMP2097]
MLSRLEPMRRRWGARAVRAFAVSIKDLGPVKKRCLALQTLHREFEDLDLEVQKKIKELRRGLLTKAQPIFAKRREIVMGLREPTPAELATGAEREGDVDLINQADHIADSGNGIPMFWADLLGQMEHENEKMFSDLDQEVMKLLLDVQFLVKKDEVKPKDKGGPDTEADETETVTLIFEFDKKAHGKWFNREQPLIMKNTFCRNIISGELLSSVGTHIKWVSDEVDPTVKVVRIPGKAAKQHKGGKFQRGKSQPKAPDTTRRQKIDSIFHVFNKCTDWENPYMDDMEDDEFDEDEDEDMDDDDDDFMDRHDASEQLEKTAVREAARQNRLPARGPPLPAVAGVRLRSRLQRVR